MQSKKNFILGGGIAGLLCSFYLKDYYIISDQLGGQNSEDFNLPQSDLEIKDKNYTYTTQLWTKTKSIELKTIIDEKQNESVVLFKINNSYDKLESQTTKTTIDIIAVVSLNFLHYVSICDKDPLNIVFVAENESLAKIDSMLLSLCTKLYPFLTFSRRIV